MGAYSIGGVNFGTLPTECTHMVGERCLRKHKAIGIGLCNEYFGARPP